MQLLIVFIMFVLILLFGIVVRVVASDLDKSERPVAFEIKLVLPEDECAEALPTGGMSPQRVHGRRHGRRGVRRRKVGQGEVSHYAKMHSRTRYHL